MEEYDPATDDDLALPDGPVLLFDGVCNLCNGLVQFVIDRDPEGRIHFAPLQSDPGRALLARAGMDPDQRESVVLVEGARYYRKSAAVLRVARHLGLPYSPLYALTVLPRFLRDAVYDLVASHRYQVFGRRDRCMVPSRDVRERFLAMDPADGDS